MARRLPPGFTELPSGRIRWRVSVHGVRYTGTADSLAAARRARAHGRGVDARESLSR